MQKLGCMAEYVIKTLKHPINISFILFLAAILYAFSSHDIVPDIPIIGWVDDVTFLVFTTLNVLEKWIGQRDDSRITLSRVVLLRVIKWSILIGGLLIMSVILLTKNAFKTLFL